MIYDVKSLCCCIECRDIYGAAELDLRGAFGVLLVSSGSVFSTGTACVLDAGSIAIFSRSASFKPSGNAHILYALLAGVAAEKAAAALTAPIISDCGACPLAAEILSLLINEGSLIRRARLSFELLCDLSGANERQEKLVPLVAQAIAEMHKSYAQLFGVEELSQQLGVSKSHLVRVFSQGMGIPPGQYLTRVRIDAAKLLLLQRKYPLDVIATLCGFSGANYLCKVFKRETGQTPAAYRKRELEKVSAEAPLTDLESSIFV